MMTDIDNIVFLVSRPNGRGMSLFTLPGQTIGKRKRILDDMMTHGCESIRRKHPVGTVFYTDGKALRFKGGCYHTETLTPFLSPDGKILEVTLETQMLIDKYKKHLHNEKQHSRNPLQ